MKFTGFNSTERVGIGVNSLLGHLHVTGGSTYKGIYVQSTVDTNTALQVEADSLTTGYAGYFYSNSATTNTRSLVYIRNDNAASTGTTSLRIDQDSTGPALVALGNVGIGTTAPGALLEVAKTSADASLKVNRTDQTNIQLIAAGSSYVRASAALILQSNGANNRLTLATDGAATFSGTLTVNDNINSRWFCLSEQRRDR